MNNGATLRYGANNTSDISSKLTISSGLIDTNGNNLNFANTDDGDTNVTTGTLVVGNGTSGSLASGSAVMVAIGAIFAGNAGTIAGMTSISGGGRLARGDGTGKSIGTETFTGTLAFMATSIFDWDINSPITDQASVDQGSYDKLINNNAAQMSGTSIFNVILGMDKSFSDAFLNTDKTWTNVFN